MSPDEIERLIILAEECGEVVQSVSKVLRFGWEGRHPDGGSTNIENLEKEVGDILTIVDHMMIRGDLDEDCIHTHKLHKYDKLMKYTSHQ